MTSKDQTFVAFTPEQAAQYASGRGHSYAGPLYQTILDYHTGPRQTLLDVGCGPGKAVFDLLPHFSRAIGCDASPGMIGQARQAAEKRGVAEKATFVECAAEGCAEALTKSEAATADMVTAAMAAHWFNLEPFYVSAAKALRPGGTLAMWTGASLYCHPSTPNAAQVQQALQEGERMLSPFETDGNRMSKSAYKTLPLPFDFPGLEGKFERETFVRKQWDTDGVPSAPANADGTAGPFLKHVETKLDDLVKALASASQVIRWREANPEKALTEEDPIVMMASHIRGLIGGESLVASPSLVVLLLRRSA